nr:MAG TPA: putative tail-component [Caudoviricetes sp.]
MKYRKAVNSALNASMKKVPIDTGRLRNSIRLTTNGFYIKLSGFNYPTYINSHHFNISRPDLCSLRTTYGWKDEFFNEFLKNLANNLGGKIR